MAIPKLKLITIMFLSGLLLLLQNSNQLVSAQPRITNTPIPVIIPTLTVTIAGSDGRFVEASPSPTFTITPELPNVILIAIVSPSDALVRDFPETGEVIGFLESSRDYQVIGQYFSWIQIQFSGSPTGRAWVYIETIRMTGNLDEIPFIDPDSLPAENSFEDNQTQTAIALFQTPGVADTATANARILTLPAEADVRTTSEFLPTYTPPAEIVERQATVDPNAVSSPTPENIAVQTVLASVTESGVPPFVPILALGLFGIIGLMISRIRR